MPITIADCKGSHGLARIEKVPDGSLSVIQHPSAKSSKSLSNPRSHPNKKSCLCRQLSKNYRKFRLYLLGSHLLLHALTLFFVQYHFAQADIPGSYLYALVVLDVFHALFEGHLYFRNDAY